MGKYAFHIAGTATKPDKARNIKEGDVDVHVIIAITSNEAINKCTLKDPIVKATFLLSKDWW